MNLFQKALRRENTGRPPVWFMRQAGRYHSHYQRLKERHSFMDICRIPELALEATMGPIRDFDFDAAILFSDLLFPLEALGMGLSYDPSPKLERHLQTVQDLHRLKPARVEQLAFQGKAMELIRRELSREKGLLGFVGGPLTLFCYAVEGTHAGALTSARAGLLDGRYEGFAERIVELLAENMALQARAGADTVAVLDTCAGEFSPELYGTHAVPALSLLFSRFRELCPGVPITYYSKGSTPAHWEKLAHLPIACLGVDWRQDLAGTLTRYGERWGIQGNIDPEWLFMRPDELESKLREVFARVKNLSPAQRRGWVCGLGHGVLPKTPESGVRLFLKIQKEMFAP